MESLPVPGTAHIVLNAHVCLSIKLDFMVEQRGTGRLGCLFKIKQ